jgi:hypothetical protein
MSLPADLLDNSNDWFRPGGHRLDFFATLDELQQILDIGLPDALAPWHLTGSDLVPRPDRPDRYYQHPWSLPNVDLASATQTPTRSRTKLFIWSERLTSGEPPQVPGTKYETLCSINGFLLLRLGHLDNFSRTTSCSWGHVDRFVNVTTGEERRYPEYLKVFNRIRRLIRKHLIAPSVLTFPNGMDWVNEHTRWTAGAIAAHASGVTFADQNRPCRPHLSELSPA